MSKHFNAESFNRNDASQFEIVYKHYHKQILFHITDNIRSTSDAEEITNDIFMNLRRAKDKTFETMDEISFFLFHIAGHAISDWYRKADRNLKMHNLPDNLDLSDDSTENEAESREVIYVLVEKAICRLRPRRQQIMQLHLQKKTCQEIGQLLGIYKTAVSRHLIKARQEIYDILHR